jgi:hypothetical protein
MSLSPGGTSESIFNVVSLALGCILLIAAALIITKRCNVLARIPCIDRRAMLKRRRGNRPPLPKRNSDVFEEGFIYDECPGLASPRSPSSSLPETPVVMRTGSRKPLLFSDDSRASLFSTDDCTQDSSSHIYETIASQSGDGQSAGPLDARVIPLFPPRVLRGGCSGPATAKLPTSTSAASAVQLPVGTLTAPAAVGGATYCAGPPPAPFKSILKRTGSHSRGSDSDDELSSESACDSRDQRGQGGSGGSPGCSSPSDYEDVFPEAVPRGRPMPRESLGAIIEEE